MSNQVCVDASVAVAWILEEQFSDQAESLKDLWLNSKIEMITSALFHFELASAIRKNVYLKRISVSEGNEAFAIGLIIPIRIFDSLEIKKKAWQLSTQYQLPNCYDMQYLAVAELMQCPFWTGDKRLINSLRGKNNLAHYLGDYSGKKNQA